MTTTYLYQDIEGTTIVVTCPWRRQWAMMPPPNVHFDGVPFHFVPRDQWEDEQ